MGKRGGRERRGEEEKRRGEERRGEREKEKERRHI